MEFSTNISDHEDDVMCILPWIHMHPWPNGKTMLCCDSPWEDHIGDLRENSLKEVWNSEKMKQVRLNMLNGKKCTQYSKPLLSDLQVLHCCCFLHFIAAPNLVK